MALTDSIQVLPGIGPKRAALFARLGVRTLGDLLRFYPRDYEDRTHMCAIHDLEPGETACFRACVISPPQTKTFYKPGGRKLTVTHLTVADDTGRLYITIFHSEYVAARIQEGETYYFYGTLNENDLMPSMTNPVFELPSEEGKITRRIIPIYSLTAGLNNRAVSQAVHAALEREIAPEVLPAPVKEKYGLCDAAFACRNIHEPSSAEALEAAKKRLIFEEFFLFSAALSMVRAERTVHRVPPYADTDLSDFYEALPFQLTGAQSRAIQEILSDFRRGIPMSRMVQGDVGSGKTMVAAAAAVCAVRNGKQAALMAPTEILARQHFETLSAMMESLGIRCALLTGSLKESIKKQVRQNIAQGEADLVIGTHALLSENTVFKDLGLVIADEQHRFGVSQRAKLLAKGTQPHLLIMSATPIPRTLALILYGDLDISLIDELPPGREPVGTFLVNESYRARLNNFIRKQAAEHHQTFIVCPAIEESETESLKAAELWAETLKKSVFPNLRVALLHGKMKGSEKDSVMEAFAGGAYDILVATTVIEVGVDVPNATLMVIENADRFGLSQLHQLRGRIGRGSAKSYCVLVSDTANAETRQRLRAFCSTTDGFKIAEEDLKLRGPGDFFGARQHGLPAFRIGNLASDLSLLKEAQAAAEEAVAGNDLPPALEAQVKNLLESEYFVLN